MPYWRFCGSGLPACTGCRSQQFWFAPACRGFSPAWFGFLLDSAGFCVAGWFAAAVTCRRLGLPPVSAHCSVRTGYLPPGYLPAFCCLCYAACCLAVWFTGSAQDAVLDCWLLHLPAFCLGFHLPFCLTVSAVLTAPPAVTTCHTATPFCHHHVLPFC